MEPTLENLIAKWEMRAEDFRGAAKHQAEIVLQDLKNCKKFYEDKEKPAPVPVS